MITRRTSDPLQLLHDALREVEHTPALAQRLRVFVSAIRALGFARAAIVRRADGVLPPLVVHEGFSAAEAEALMAIRDRREDWERRRDAFDRFAVEGSYWLAADDLWVREEFGGAGALPWGERSVLISPLRGPDGRRLATLFLAGTVGELAPEPELVRAVEVFGQQVGSHVEQDRLTALASRRVDRLQRLQQVGSALSRSLDEREIARELARGVLRVLECDGVVIAQPDLDRGTSTTLARLVHGEERPIGDAAPLGDGAIARVARTGEPVLVADYRASASPLAAADDVLGDARIAGSLLAVPLRIGIRLLGVLAVHADRPDHFRAEDVDLLLTMGAQAASTLSNARLYAESERERRQSEALADVARAVGASLRTGEVMRLILRHAMALVRADGAHIALRTDDYLHVVAAAGSGDVLAGMHLPVGASIAGRAVCEATPIISNDVPADPLLYPPEQRLVRVQRMAVVPLIAARGPIGTLSVINRATAFADADARILQRLADQVAVAIVNARLYEELAEAMREWSVAFDSVATGMVMLDEGGRIARYNTRALQLAELTTQRELVGRQFYEAILHEARKIGDGCPLDRALTEGVTGRATLRSVARGRLFDVVAAPHPNGGAVVTFDDITAVHGLAERHRLIVETASDAIVTLDLERRVTYANPAALDLFARRGALAGTAWRELLLPELAEEADAYGLATLEGMPQRYECTVLRGDGERRVVSVSQVPLRDAEGVTGIVAALRDMTDERRARDAVSQSEARYRNLFESASDAIYTVDRHGAVTSVNRAASELLGESPELLLGRSVARFLATEERGAVEEQFEQALAGHARRFECTLVRADGERRLLSVTNTPLRHGRRVIGVLGIARDITAERDRARALRHSELRFENLIEAASDGIFTLDEEGHFTSVNHALERATGHPRARLVGMHFTDVIDPRDRDGLWEVFVGALHDRRLRRELRYVDADGIPRAASVTVSPVVEGGSVTSILGIVRDVQDEKALAERMLQQEKLSAIGNLVSGVAHELNNPLASVMAYSELALHDALVAQGPDETRRMLGTIHDEARRAARIVSNLLTFAREYPPHRAATSLSEVVRATLELRRYALTVHGTTVEESLDDTLPPTWADPFQLQQVVLNLLANAEHALDGWTGERRIRVSTFRRDDTLVIEVTDTGRGIDPGEVSRIFNPFYTTRPVGKGTGLGLSITDGIVRGHGGEIRVDSRPAAGTTIIVELPYVPPLSPDHAVPPATPMTAPSAGARSLLVVDDEPAICDVVVRYFSQAGHRVDAARSGADARRLIAERRYDAILLDLRMPDLSGDVLYAEILARDPALAARVVFLSGDLVSGQTREFLERSGRPTVAKPFSFEALEHALAGVLGA